MIQEIGKLKFFPHGTAEMKKAVKRDDRLNYFLKVIHMSILSIITLKI